MSETPPQTPKTGLSGAVVVTILALCAFLGIAIWFAVYAWNLFPGTQMSTNGTIAMVLGIVFATAVGIALMGLLFWSSRKGYDR
jgi:hypothetical protein